MAVELPELLVSDAAAWRSWLEAHHGGVGVWLILAKKGTTVPTSLRYAEALDEALCFGWIDSQMRRRDESTLMQRFTPRGPRSPWSARNVTHIARLQAERRMHSAGLAAVEQARADGRWDVAYAGPAAAEVPVDFAAAITADPAAQAMFAVLTSQNRYALVFRLAGLKTAAARTRRMAQYVEMLARGETIYPQKRRPAPPV